MRDDDLTTSPSRGSLAAFHVSLHNVLRGPVWTLVGMWALSSLWYPFGWDQGIMASVGDTIVRGGMPYRDAFDIKGPASYYIFALAEALFGHNLWGIRLLDLAGLAGTAWLISSLVARYTERDAGPWAAALFILWFAGLTYWHTAQPDGFAAMLLSFGFLPLLRSDSGRSIGRSAWAGVMLGVTACIKPDYAMFLLVPAVLLWTRMKSRKGAMFLHLAVTASSALAVVGLVLAWFAYRGALDALVEAHIVYNEQVYTSGASLALGSRLRGLVEYVLAGKLFVVLLPAAIFGAVRLYHSHRAAMLALTTWAALALAGVVLQNKFFDYQWIPIFPPVVILAVVGLHAALRGHRLRYGAMPDGTNQASIAPGLGFALALVILFHAVVQPAFEVSHWAAYVTGIRGEAAYYDAFGGPGQDHRMAEYIEEHSRPGDRLYIMGWNADIQYMTGLPTVSRLLYALPVWMGKGTALRRKYRAELMTDLTATPPEWIVVGSLPELLIGRKVTLDEFPEFQALLAEHYERNASYGDLVLYKLR